MRFVFILFSLISFSALGLEVELDSIRSEERGEGLFVIHEVEEEETLFSIARRYKSSIPSIIKFNDIENNRIELGQILSVLFEENDKGGLVNTLSQGQKNVHLVREGETLYSISREYNLKLRDLKKLNDLETNDISPGQYLIIKEANQNDIAGGQERSESDSITKVKLEDGIPEGFELYLVQTGETLISIAKKSGVRKKELKDWNNLTSDYLRIGQKLIIRKMVESENLPDSTTAETKLNDDGFERAFEVGIAAVISKISTSKYLALHRSLPIGTELEVRNLMNNLVVHVKIVGKLPNTGINKNVLLRLSQPAIDQLRILDPKSRVEVSYFKE